MTEPAALVFEERRFSAPELHALADGWATALAKDGVTAGQRVAVMASNRPEFLAVVLAIWRLAASAVLISPAWKRDEVDHALALTGPAHAVGDHPVLAGLMPMLHLDEPVPPADPATGPAPPAEADAALVFSSGTTGLPKAVRHTHASLDEAVRHWRHALQLTHRDRIQVATPPSHILGLLNLLTAWETGACVRLHRRFDIDRVLHHIESDRITVEMAVAPIALAIASHPGLESYDLSSLRYIMWGATPVNANVAQTVTRRTGVSWLPAYGTTELPVIACNPIEDARLDTVGRAVPGVDLRVVSLETGEPVGPGEVGEIQARSASLMAGYLPAEATGEAIRDGWYRTGDVGWLDTGGWLRITDRLKEMIKVRGFQVAPAEIEAVLHGHPAVKDCAVFGIPDGTNGEAIVAAVATSAPVDAPQLTALVDEKLASYKHLSRVVFVPEIPRLPSGKVLRRVLKERHGCTSDN
ncbi:class I adenylate-forming enzyme family protein [Mycobacterium intracellulare]|uniref:AMP-binding enzyme n=1 Tax=Mycobacterium intracellulare subsp. chimaera TaxID=222805 RepID=A0A220Y7N2_MYCIT|nr:class I adenylate-forming enzyme family protein [Mycobacterium intracellulare]AOS90896.1 AMP-dependent synthetase [Mycobacterium intracellulare subsp. chimaera]ARV80851.1 AMP-dependent synthetase [Mycobacterium intracellulare subsp. chimaera]ASL07842.1 AMP-binding enzyme [Mycobacterium intracellulare subsp. chimaera]ASL13495.1 AMP-binding enzyme [Mycobacterium intracellulare subsp. chimaera]ASL19629.1 AMP-binding enzyme [Mycobacterium intracellulare subsp. chimaera]